MKKFVLVAMLLFASVSFAQQLTYKRGDIMDSNGKELAKTEMRALLATKPGLLNYYNAGTSKKNVGGFLLGFGGGLILGDLIGASVRDVPYPTPLTFIGAATMLVSIPVSLGYKKKLKTVVNDYNKEIAADQSDNRIDDVDFVINQNGAGLRIQF